MATPTKGQTITAFQMTAADLIELAHACGESPVVERECLYDYLHIHGGRFGRLVSDWVMKFDGNLERELDSIGVPRSYA